MSARVERVRLLTRAILSATERTSLRTRYRIERQIYDPGFTIAGVAARQPTSVSDIKLRSVGARLFKPDAIVQEQPAKFNLLRDRCEYSHPARAVLSVVALAIAA
jgi:hypothetical protein